MQDLAFSLPLMAVAAWWLWRRRPWGLLLVGGLLTMWVVESLGVAADQLLGAAADPSSSVVSAAAGVGFAAYAVLSLVPAWLFLRDVDRFGRA